MQGEGPDAACFTRQPLRCMIGACNVSRRDAPRPACRGSVGRRGRRRYLVVPATQDGWAYLCIFSRTGTPALFAKFPIPHAGRHGTAYSRPQHARLARTEAATCAVTRSHTADEGPHQGQGPRSSCARQAWAHRHPRLARQQYSPPRYRTAGRCPVPAGRVRPHAVYHARSPRSCGAWHEAQC